MISPPLISVILPSHAPSRFFDEAVESVVAQSIQDWELLIIGDGLDPRSPAMARLEARDERIRVLCQRRAGVSVARNRGVLAASAATVSFLDHDDVWDSEKLERQIAAMSSEVDYCYTGFSLIGGSGERLGDGYGRAVDYHDLLRGEMGVLQSSLAVRREALVATGGYNPLLKMQQDLDLVLRLAKGWRGSYLPTELVGYRLHAGNASRNFALAAREHVALLDLHALAARSIGDRSAVDAARSGAARVRRTYSYQGIDAARRAWNDGMRRRACLDLLTAASLSPGPILNSFRSFARTRRTEVRSNLGRS